jgi:catechol 2,3-dioxygenase-like lactoylglutathione lyase family enzyme
MINGILESALYVDDVARSADFYKELFKLRELVRDERICVLAVAEKQVLLIFKKGGTLNPVDTPGGVVPPHDGAGQLHMAFEMPEDEVEVWRTKLKEAGIEIESEVDWQTGGKSLYFRDPDGHCLELATRRTWGFLD